MHGYLCIKKAEEIIQQINVLSEVAPEEVPKDSQFLLEINFSKLSTFHLNTQTNWTLAMDAALKAKALESARGARAKWIRRRLNTKIPSRMKLGITSVEQQIRQDRMHRATTQPDALQSTDNSQLSLDCFVHQQPHPASIAGDMRSNKRLRKPD